MSQEECSQRPVHCCWCCCCRCCAVMLRTFQRVLWMVSKLFSTSSPEHAHISTTLPKSQQQLRPTATQNPTHFEKFGTVLLTQLVVEHCDSFLQVPPLSGYLPLPLLQLLQLLLSFSSQSLQVPALLLIQETMEVLKLGPDFSFQGIETGLKKWDCGSSDLFLVLQYFL